MFTVFVVAAAAQTEDPAVVLAFIGLITAVLTLGTAIVLFIRTGRVDRKIQEVNINVDGHLSTLTARVEQLTQSLERSDTDVPPSPPNGGPAIEPEA